MADMNGKTIAAQARDTAQGQNRTDLARQIQITINTFVKGRAEMGRPMTAEEIIGTIFFCGGFAIGGQVVKGADAERLRHIALKFAADAQAVAEGKRPASEFIIMPDALN